MNKTNGTRYVEPQVVQEETQDESASSITNSPLKYADGVFGSDAELGAPKTLEEDDMSHHSTNAPVTTIYSRRQGIALKWNDINMSVGHSFKRGGTTTQVLLNVSGAVRPYRLTAIMGHSGADQPPQHLAGRIQASKSVHLNGKITLDRQKFDPSREEDRRKIAFVAQYDTLLGMATPREAIWFSARMRLDKKVTNEQVTELTQALLEKLALEKVADNRIAPNGGGGLSGGEKRRVSLGIELVVQPCLILLDEVTSGLDSFNAMEVLKTLQAVSQWSGMAVLFTVHQPSSDMFGMIDDVLLLRYGRCMYQGSVSKIRPYFAARNYEVPPDYNLADHILSVSQKASSEEELVQAGFFKDFPIEAVGRPPLRRKSSVFEVMIHKISLFQQVWLLLKRRFRSFFRDVYGLLLRFGVILCGAIVIAICYAGVARNGIETTSSLLSHTGVTFMMATSLLISAQVKIVEDVEARPVLTREFLTAHYSAFAHTTADFLFDCFLGPLLVIFYLLVIFWSIGFQGNFLFTFIVGSLMSMIGVSMGGWLASVFRYPAHALHLSPLLLLPQQLLAGFVVAIPDLSPFIRWLAYLMPSTYTFRLFLANEFAFCTAVPEHVSLVKCVNTAVGSDFDLFNSPVPFIHEGTTLTLPQTGTYKGILGIEDYLFLFSPNASIGFSLADNSCFIPGTLEVVNIDATEGVCSITVGTLQQYDINPNLRTDGAEALTTVTGFRFEYEQSEPEDFVIDSLDVFFGGDGHFEEFFSQVNQTKTALVICDVLESGCPDVFAQNNFTDFNDCVAHMSQLPMVEENEDGQVFLDSNTTGCRVIHANLAVSDPKHCPHLSFYPMEDAEGNIQCHQSQNRTDEGTFGKSLIQKFVAIGASNGLEHNLFESISFEERRTCLAEGDFAADVGASLMNTSPPEVLCMLYLSTQGALGDRNLTYSFILLGMLAFFRIVGALMLRYRLNQSLIV